MEPMQQTVSRQSQDRAVIEPRAQQLLRGDDSILPLRQLSHNHAGWAISLAYGASEIAHPVRVAAFVSHV
jgi:hypothetical protein